MHYRAEDIPEEIGRGLWARLIAPRPIALISTQDSDGLSNIAAYNSFTGLSTYPPLLGISFSLRNGAEKRTLSNIKESGVFVVNLVPRFLADIMVQSAADSAGDDFQRLGLTPSAAQTVNCPRIAESPAAMECRLVNVVVLPPSRCEMVVAQISGVFMRDEYITQNGSFDPLAADLLASVGVEDYISLNGEVLHVPKSWDLLCD